MNIQHTAQTDLGQGLSPGDDHYRAYVGPPEKFDLVGAMQFNLLTALGLREEHTLLDIGCGSLRAGKLFLPYLLSGNYYGMEPNDWLIQEGIEKELGKELITLKSPTFSNDEQFTLTTFGTQFDYMVAQSIFSHASEKQIDRCFEQAKKSLKDTGVFAATFVLGENNYEGDEWVYPGCVTYTMEWIQKKAQSHGLVAQRLKWQHPNGQTWFAITHPTHANQIPEVADLHAYTELKNEYDTIRTRLNHIEAHPIVRIGGWVYRLFSR